MPKLLNKRMVVTINKMCIEMVNERRSKRGKETTEKFSGDNNMIDGNNLDFVDRIATNDIFGTEPFPTIYHRAAAYMYFIINEHPFIDGNKRTGLAAAITFLEWNNLRFSAFEENDVFTFVTNLTLPETADNDSSDDISKVADWFEGLCIH